MVTDRRVLAVWRQAGRTSVAGPALADLLPPEIAVRSVQCFLARPRLVAGRSGLASLTWPATTSSPPGLVGVPDKLAIRNLICAGQLALRAR